MNQRDQVILYLKDHKTITQREALTELGIMDLAGVMRDLRDLGYTTVGVWTEGLNRYGEKVRFKEYAILSEPKKEESTKRPILHLKFNGR